MKIKESTRRIQESTEYIGHARIIHSIDEMPNMYRTWKNGVVIGVNLIPDYKLADEYDNYYYYEVKVQNPFPTKVGSSTGVTTWVVAISIDDIYRTF